MITSTKYCCTKVIYIWSVYADGSICLDILQNQWSPIYDVAAILTSIQVCELFRFSMGGFFFSHFNCISFMHSCFSSFYQNCQELFSSPLNHFYMELLKEPSPGHKKILSLCNILIVQFIWSNNLTAICSLQSLLCDPNPNSPANSEAARMFSENKREYNRRVREIVEQSWTAD